MSDFEQWALTKGGYTSDDLVKIKGHPELEDGDYEYEYVRSARDAFNAAIASMQGEANPYAKITFCALEGWATVDEIDGSELHDGTVTVFTYPPSAASKIAEQDAEISRLQKELEEARKDAIQHCKQGEPKPCRCDTGEWQGNLCGDCNGTGITLANPEIAELKRDAYNRGLEDAAKAAEHYSLAEKLARLTMANPVTHSINVTKVIADTIRAIKQTDIENIK